MGCLEGRCGMDYYFFKCITAILNEYGRMYMTPDDRFSGTDWTNSTVRDVKVSWHNSKDE